MKNKINKWGNSHGIRLSQAILDHLNAEDGDQLEIKMTKTGIEIIKTNTPLDELKSLKKQIFNDLLKHSDSVKEINNPNEAVLIDYIIIDINPCQPVIREVPKNTKGAYKTLAAAKYAAREIIQQSVAQAQSSLADIRQLGIKKIRYIEL